ncbi:MAG: ATP-binding protein [Desulfobacteraceae bacterium]|jgi:predicted HTH transcriptional regulator|nr:ATP-binding protein [Desulfobacteraceae bacterium]MDD3990897.1 ATP-binding protein [Desulfobacteraceae bacterium]
MTISKLLQSDEGKTLESMGILLPGLTIEEMKQGTSRIRNPVIARVFKELHLIEQWGTGVRRIFAEARELGLPEPKIEEIALRLRFTVYLAKPHRIPADTRKAMTEEKVEATTQQVTQQVKRLLAVCVGEWSRAELMKSIGLKDRVTFARNYLEPALAKGFVEMTQPDSPTSPTQKYRLTEKGKKLLEGGK